MKATLLILFAIGIVAADRLPLVLGQEKAFKLQQRTTAAYSVQVPDPAPQGKLFVVVEDKASDFYGPPSVRMALSQQHFGCSSGPSSTVCMVSERDVKFGHTFKVDVSCVAQCELTIKAYIDREFQLQLEDEILTTFTEEGETFEAVVKIPQKVEFTEIQVVATINNPEDVTGGLELYVNADENVAKPTAKQHQHEGKPIWNDGMGVFLSSSQVKAGGTVRLLLKGSKNMVVSITCFSVRDNSRDIVSGQRVYDDVKADKTKVYVLDLSDNPNIKSSGDVEIKLVQFVGASKLAVSPDKYFNKSSVIEGSITESITQLSISPKTRESLGYVSHFYISVTGEEESTFMLQASLSQDDFVLLENDIAQLSSVAGEQIDSYIYTFVAKELPTLQQNLRDFYLSVQVVSEDVGFGIMRCQSLEKSGSHECLLKNLQQVNANPQLFQQIKGYRYNDVGVSAFAFQYDIRNCTPQHEGTYKCAFLVVCFNSANSSNQARYVLNFWEGGQEMSLQQAVPRRVRALQGQLDRYSLVFPTVTEISSVKFILTVISGNCYLSGSTNRTAKEIGDERNRLATKNILKYGTPISDQYYLKVLCVQPSYYSLLAVVTRGESGSLQPFQLAEGISQQFYLGKAETDEFYIRLAQPLPFRIQLINIRGHIEYEVYPSNHFEANESVSWQSKDDGFLSINNSDQSYTSNNEFLVRATSLESESIFEIVYLREGECPIFNTNRPVFLKLPQGEERCYAFSLNNLADVQVVVSTSYFDMTTGDLNVSYTINGSYPRQLSSRVTNIPAQQVKSACPNLYTANRSDCQMEVDVKSVTEKTVNMVVQEQNGHIELFDGLEQHISNPLSRGLGKYFYYDVTTQKSISVVLKSSTHTRYRLMARFASEKDVLLGRSMYPTFTELFFYHSDTNDLGETMLVISQRQTFESVKSNLLLISVYSHGFTEDEATFKLTLFHQTTKIHPSEIKAGFVEKRESRRYTLSTTGEKELIVHVNTYEINCVKLQLIRQKTDNGTTTEEMLRRSFTGDLIVAPSDKPEKYIVEVTGTRSCSYELSYSESELKIFELAQGKLFNLELKPEEKMYLLYYHIRDRPFRLVTMGESGELRYDARTLPAQATNDLPNYIKTLSGPWQFSQTNRQQSLTIDPKVGGCNDCYYLIQVSSSTAAAALVVLHSIESPIAIRQNRIVRETLSSSIPNISYVLFSSADFTLSLKVVYGTLSVQVKHSSNGAIHLQKDIDSNAELPIEFKGKKHHRDQNTVHNGSAYIITVSCNNSCSYSLAVDISGHPRRLVEGLPHQLQLNSSINSSCVQFLTLEQPASTHLLLAADNISNVVQDIKCYTTDTFQPCQHTQNLIVAETAGSNSKSIQLISERGYYVACFKLATEEVVTRLTITRSGNNNLRYIEPNGYNLLTASPQQKPVEMELYHPDGVATMIELFQCSGALGLQATADFQQFRSNKTAFTQSVKAAGHSVISLHTENTKEPMAFARLTIKDTTQPKSVAMIRYSSYPAHLFPYSQLGASSESISYVFADDKIHFTVIPIEANKNYKVLSATYHLAIANTSESVREWVQCQTNSIYTRSISTGHHEVAQDITFPVELSDIDSYGSDEYFFVGVYAEVEAVQVAANTSSQVYRFIYDQLQMANTRPGVGFESFTKNVKWVTLWIILPLLALVLLLTLSWKWFRMYSRRYAMEIQVHDNTEDKGDTNTNETKDVATTKNLILPDSHIPSQQNLQEV